MTKSPRGYDYAAAGLASGMALLEVVRVVVTGRIAAGYTMLATLTLGLTFAVVLAIAAVGLALHRRTGWLCGILGFITAASYGVLLRSSGAWIGVLYLFASLILLGLLMKALHGYRIETPAEA